MHLSDSQFLAHTGRLMRYDVASKKVSVLFDGLCFGNGVALSPKEDFVLFNDIGRFRIWKQYLRGPKAGQTEVFVDLPGRDTNSIVFYLLFCETKIFVRKAKH